MWLADMKCSFLQLFTLNKTRRRASALPEEDDNFINITADVKPALLRNSVRDVLPILCINTLNLQNKELWWISERSGAHLPPIVVLTSLLLPYLKYNRIDAFWPFCRSEERAALSQERRGQHRDEDFILTFRLNQSFTFLWVCLQTSLISSPNVIREIVTGIILKHNKFQISKNERIVLLAERKNCWIYSHLGGMLTGLCTKLDSRSLT